MREYTIKQIAEITGKGKSTIRRLIDSLPPECISSGEYRGHASILVSEDGFKRIKFMLMTPESTSEAINEANTSDFNGSIIDSNAPKDTNELISELRSRIEAQDHEIQVKNEQISRLTTALEKAQEATAAAQALHAATAEQLRLLTAHEEESTQKASFADRLRHLFRGR